MLKKFFINTLSSFVGAWIALLLVGVVGCIVLFGFIGRLALSQNPEQVKSRSVLKIELAGPIEEYRMEERPDPRDIITGNFSSVQTLDVLIEGIRLAADNDNIAAIYLDCGNVQAAPATLNALREAISDFRKSGKKVLAYGDELSMGAYFVASAADSVFLNPGGSISLSGLGSTSMYMKDLFDKLGIEFQVVKVGSFKSAVEPYIMQEMSAPARAQLDTLYTNMWGYIRDNIAKSRKGVTANGIDSLINIKNISFAPTSLAKKSGLVDNLIYGRNMKSRLASLVGAEEDKLNFVSPSTLVNQTDWANSFSGKDRIAVLYAVGEIADGSDRGINYENLVPLIVKLADDKDVKGMVLRVNSPGGSAFGSEQIGEALDYFRSKGKPLAVSMGDYAASGGYWISSCADIIYADPLTITGSIGIFGLIPNFSGTMNKLGVSPQTVATNPSANFPTGIRPMDARQLEVMQAYVDRGYEQFVSRVAKGRRKSVEAIKRIGEGRVWDAMMAQRIGLVDSLGSMSKAIEWTARKAGISNKYNLGAYPQFSPGIWSFISENGLADGLVSSFDEDYFRKFVSEYVKTILARKPIQARMPEISVGFGL
ncbi:MAG: signal peptide peptidase SppA [Muribaculaceae bacterium]|nr:signal peptide peptidase SppA [Muribaculaceae bacterium]